MKQKRVLFLVLLTAFLSAAAVNAQLYCPAYCDGQFCHVPTGPGCLADVPCRPRVCSSPNVV